MRQAIRSVPIIKINSSYSGGGQARWEKLNLKEISHTLISEQ